MSAAVEMASDRRAELVGWAICFAAVVAANGLGVMALMDNATEASDFGVDTPVVVVDLPESFVQGPAPVQDLPPGPLQEEQSDPTPPQREEKPPELQAELSLPIPEPPKLEPPSEEKQATAPPHPSGKPAFLNEASVRASGRFRW